jgi:hypothetical protein
MSSEQKYIKYKTKYFNLLNKLKNEYKILDGGQKNISISNKHDEQKKKDSDFVIRDRIRYDNLKKILTKKERKYSLCDNMTKDISINYLDNIKNNDTSIFNQNEIETFTNEKYSNLINKQDLITINLDSNGKKITQCYDLISAYKWFITDKKKFDPRTNIIIKAEEIDKIKKVYSINNYLLPLDFIVQVQTGTFPFDNLTAVSEAINSEVAVYYYLPDILKDNLQITLLAVNINGSAIEFASDRLRDHDFIAVDSVNNFPLALEFVSERLRDNEELVLFAVEKNGVVLAFASNKLKNNETIVTAAIMNNGIALEFASEILQDNETIVLTAIYNNPYALSSVSERLKNNYTIVLEAVKSIGLVLQFASDALKDNRIIVIAAIKYYPKALDFASERLKKEFDY